MVNYAVTRGKFLINPQIELRRLYRSDVFHLYIQK